MSNVSIPVVSINHMYVQGHTHSLFTQDLLFSSLYTLMLVNLNFVFQTFHTTSHLSINKPIPHPPTLCPPCLLHPSVSSTVSYIGKLYWLMAGSGGLKCPLLHPSYVMDWLQATVTVKAVITYTLMSSLPSLVYTANPHLTLSMLYHGLKARQT